MKKLFDTHTHYDDAKFENESESRYKLLDRLFENEVGLILGASVNLETSRFQIDLSSKYEGFFAAVGVHPENCGEYTKTEPVIKALEDMLKEPKVVAIGEIGLDYYWEQNPSKEVQQIWFDKQLELALKTGYPVIIHDREAHGASFDTVSKYRGVKGVFHSYSGSAEMATELVKMGFYISFSGVITFKNAVRIAEVVKSIPDDRILIETDCPYLAPVPFRGKVNNSGYARYTAEKAAEIRGVPIDEFVEMTYENGKRLFGIK